MMQYYHGRGCRQFVADIGIYFKFWGARTNTKRFFNNRAGSSLFLTFFRGTKWQIQNFYAPQILRETKFED